LILTNVRTDAVLKLKLAELDLEQALWSVPLANLKDRRYRKEAFRVPLSPRAVEIVREMERIRVSDYVFPGQASEKPLSNMALLVLLKRMNSVATEKWVDPTDHRARLSRDLSDLGRGDHWLPPCGDRRGHGAPSWRPG
jgi:integrase